MHCCAYAGNLPTGRKVRGACATTLKCPHVLTYRQLDASVQDHTKSTACSLLIVCPTPNQAFARVTVQQVASRCNASCTAHSSAHKRRIHHLKLEFHSIAGALAPIPRGNQPLTCPSMCPAWPCTWGPCALCRHVFPGEPCVGLCT